MAKRNLLGIALGLTVGFLVTSCISFGGKAHGYQLQPNASQSVISMKRGSSSYEKGKKMEIYIDGRSQQITVPNGGQGQILLTNGLHNIYVKIGKYQSQMLTFDSKSEVVEFYANFEGDSGLLFGIGSSLELNLTKTSGGSNASSNNNQPSINITVDNSSSNSASSSGNTVNVGDDNSVR